MVEVLRTSPIRESASVGHRTEVTVETLLPASDNTNPNPLEEIRTRISRAVSERVRKDSGVMDYERLLHRASAWCESSSSP